MLRATGRCIAEGHDRKSCCSQNWHDDVQQVSRGGSSRGRGLREQREGKKEGGSEQGEQGREQE